MQTILSTAGMRPNEAFEYWMDVACARIIKHQSEPLDRHNFYAEIKAGSLADLSILTWQTAPTVCRNKRDDDDLLLMLPLRLMDKSNLATAA